MQKEVMLASAADKLCTHRNYWSNQEGAGREQVVVSIYLTPLSLAGISLMYNQLNGCRPPKNSVIEHAIHAALKTYP